jgi:hypothetical protein
VSCECCCFGCSQFRHRSFLKVTNSDLILKYFKTFSFIFPAEGRSYLHFSSCLKSCNRINSSVGTSSLANAT